MDAIIADSLVKRFDTDKKIIVAVDSLSLTIPRGEIVALLGPNGAGKTTTVRVIASLYKPNAGSVLVNGMNSELQSLEVRRSIGIAHERPSFYKRLTGRRNLRFYADLYDVPPAIQNSRIEQLASEFDLLDALDQPVGSYSKGMQQKLSVVKALLHDPEILIMDEPWSGLSPEAARGLRQKIVGLREQGKTILITTHNLSQAEKVADSLFIISHGKLIAKGSPKELRSKFQLHPEIEIRLTSGTLPHSLDIGLPFVSSFRVDGDTLMVEIDSFSKTPELIHYLVSSDFQIQEVKENIPSLEDVYLHLVEASQ